MPNTSGPVPAGCQDDRNVVIRAERSGPVESWTGEDKAVWVTVELWSPMPCHEVSIFKITIPSHILSGTIQVAMFSVQGLSTSNLVFHKISFERANVHTHTL